MKITVFSSNQPRHISLARELGRIADEVFYISEVNTVFPGKVADFFNKSEEMQNYFEKVIESEAKIFGEIGFIPNNVRTLSIKSGDLNRLNRSKLEEALKSDVYVNLSRIESFGITFVEALGANIPVITFDSKGANEIIKNNFNGFITRKNKVFLLCKKIFYFEKNKKKFKSNPLSSSKKYDLKFLYGKYLKIYRNLV